mgnify:CR=1 FL=1
MLTLCVCRGQLIARGQSRIPLDTNRIPSFIMHEQMNKDVTKDAIQSRLSREVQANFNVFMQGMKHVQEVDLDIARGIVTVNNSLRKLQAGREGLVKPVLRVCRLRRRRERLADVRRRVMWLKQLMASENEVRTLLRARDYVSAVAMCVENVEKLSTEEATGFKVLDQGPRRRLQNMLPAVRLKLDEVRGGCLQHGIGGRALRCDMTTGPHLAGHAYSSEHHGTCH